MFIHLNIFLIIWFDGLIMISTYIICLNILPGWTLFTTPLLFSNNVFFVDDLSLILESNFDSNKWFKKKLFVWKIKFACKNTFRIQETHKLRSNQNSWKAKSNISRRALKIKTKFRKIVPNTARTIYTWGLKQIIVSNNLAFVRRIFFYRKWTYPSSIL